MKPFLILQLRPEAEASDNEYEAILSKSGLSSSGTHRIRLDQEIIPGDLDLGDYSGVIVGGGPGCVSDDAATKSDVEKQIETSVFGLLPQITANDVPFLGCCYGIGVLGHHLGAVVSKERYGEAVGAVDCSLTDAGKDDPVLAGVSDVFRAFVGHKEALQELPRGCVHLASSPACPYQLIRYGENVYATQFHPELDAAGIEFRIRIYMDRGYFRPEEAEGLIRLAHSQVVDDPALVLKNFVRIYARD